MFQLSFKIPLFTRNTAKKIETNGAEFREGMTRKMRFCQQTKAGDSASVGELMPLRFSHRPEAKAEDNPLK